MNSYLYFVKSTPVIRTGSWIFCFSRAAESQIFLILPIRAACVKIVFIRIVKEAVECST